MRGWDLASSGKAEVDLTSFPERNQRIPGHFVTRNVTAASELSHVALPKLENQMRPKKGL